jgi:uncharacterized protein (TIGR02996 family)
MSDGASLHAAVCANPDDDTQRLVYADWLEENGQEKRAAYIRAEVDRYRCVNADTTAAAVGAFLDVCDYLQCDWLDWAARDEELDCFHKAAMRATGRAGKPTLRSENLPKIKGVKFGNIERGFHSLVTVSNPDGFLADPDVVFRAAPITGIAFTRLSAEQARAFVAAGHLARMRHLGFGYRVEPEAIRIIGNHQDAAGVRSLLQDVNIGAEEGSEAVAEGACWTGVTRLELKGDAYEEETLFAVTDLLRRPQFRRIRYLRAAEMMLGNSTCRAIANAGLTELRHLDLAMNDIEESGAGALASSKSLSNLRFLDLDGNDVGGDSAAALINTPKLPSLTALILGDISNLNAKVLARESRGPMLRGLSLRYGELTTRALSALAASPAVAGLWFLELDQCQVTDARLAALAKHAGFRHLVVLRLWEKAVTEQGVIALAKCPALESLQELHLETKAIGSAGARAIVESPYLQGLKRLSVSGSRGMARLRKHFGNEVVP